MPRERRSKYANDAKDTSGIASQVESLSASLAQSAPYSVFKGANGKKYGVVAGVIRNEGSGWALISDELHTYINIKSIGYDPVGKTIIVDYSDLLAAKVVTFLAVPDETFAIQGYLFGASVATNKAYIKVGRSGPAVSGRVYFDGTNWQVDTAYNSGATRMASPAFSSSAARIDHASVPNAVPIVQSKNGTLTAVADVWTDARTNVKFYDNAGVLVSTPNTNMDFVISRGVATEQVDPGTLVSGSANIWLYGVMELA
jgi:hypothetical protein